MSDFETTAPDPTGPAGAGWSRGTEVGRFLVLETLGSGGVGTVVAAYDPQLDRRVAIKRLHASATTAERRERVLREARALARVVHPNIVGVYDAGFHAGELFVVMELVDGQNLRQWLKERPRSTAEVLDVFAQAGAGLVAAHGAGMVHRDFKPDNVLVGRDGRVRVADFGLARIVDAGLQDPTRTPDGNLTDTRTGALVGTPAYMAPEQHRGSRVDERADQFAFCVALHEALHGKRPFPGESYEELSENVCSGRRDPGERRVAGWIEAALERGLALRPEDRFPSMAALVAALAADPRAARRRRWAVAGAAAALAATAAGVVVFTRGEPMCRAGSREVRVVWSAAPRAAVEKAFLVTGKPYAGETFARAAARLDDYAAGWSAMRDEACAANHVRGTQSDATLDLRMRCLDGRLAALRETVSLLSAADAAAVDKAVVAVNALPPVAGCEDVEALSATGAPPPALRARVDEIGAALAGSAARRQAGRHGEAIAIAARAVEEARAVGWRPLLAAALHERALVEVGLGAYAQAEITLREGLEAAAGAHDDGVAARIAVQLATVVGQGLVRVDDVARQKPFVEAALARGGDDAARIKWRALLGQMARRRGKLDEAEVELQAVLALRERSLPPGDPAIADALRALGVNQTDQGRYDEARATLERALALAEAAYGKEHPEVADFLGALADVIDEQGDYAKAAALHDRALGISERARGVDHVDTARIAINCAIAHIRLGDHARAEELLLRALRVREKAFGPEHPHLASPLTNLGVLYERTGRLDEAERVYRRALAIHEKTVGLDHPRAAAVAGNLGLVLTKQGKYAEAIPLLERDLRVTTAALGEDHPKVGLSLLNLAEPIRELGRYAEAEKLLEKSRAVLEKALGKDHPQLAHVELGMGKLELARGRKAQAVPHLERALALRVAGGVDPLEVEEVRELLRRLGR